MPAHDAGPSPGSRRRSPALQTALPVVGFIAARAGWGTLLLGRPHVAARVRTPGALATGQSRRDAVVVRLLGVRDVAQAAVTLARPTRGVLRVGAGVDGLHALSMAALALGSSRHRRAATIAAGVASANCLAGAALSAWRPAAADGG